MNIHRILEIQKNIVLNVPGKSRQTLKMKRSLMKTAWTCWVGDPVMGRWIKILTSTPEDGFDQDPREEQLSSVLAPQFPHGDCLTHEGTPGNVWGEILPWDMST